MFILANVPDKYEHIDFKPPESVAKEAEKGLEYRRKQGEDKAGLTPEEAGEKGIGSGVQRAVNLKNRTNLQPDTINQMVAFFARHEKNKSIADEHKGTPWKDKGYVSWLLWGGDSGRSWAEKIQKQMETADEKAKKDKKKESRRIASRVVRRILSERLPLIAREDPKFAYDLYRQEDLNRGNSSSRSEFPVTDQMSSKILGELDHKIDRLSDEIEQAQDMGVDHSRLWDRREDLMRKRKDIQDFLRDTLGFKGRR